jgi:hypothetical protein
MGMLFWGTFAIERSGTLIPVHAPWGWPISVAEMAWSILTNPIRESERAEANFVPPQHPDRLSQVRLANRRILG